MQLTQLAYKLDDSILTQRVVTLKIGPKDVQRAVDQVAAKLKPTLSAPGFRRGKAPLSMLRKAHWSRISDEALAELLHASIEQTLAKLDGKHQPFLPPEVQERDKLRLHYGEELEFSIRYLVDPAGIGRRPEQPELQPGLPGQDKSRGKLAQQGQVRGPKLPGMPALPSAPATPQLPQPAQSPRPAAAAGKKSQGVKSAAEPAIPSVPEPAAVPELPKKSQT